tara:strand:+ start:60 stop:644 length:585 start_codon:yes stop_codon:yes gene_type:complete
MILTIQKIDPNFLYDNVYTNIMATFSHETFITHDDWTTPKHAWQDIAHLIPKGKIWEAFYGEGKSGQYLRELGFETIHEPINFFDDSTRPDYEVLVSNPPFSQAAAILKKLVQIDKPFILLMPCSKICCKYTRDTFKNKLQVIIPPKRIKFTKLVNKEAVKNYQSAPNFDCFYYCYKINLPRDLLHIDSWREAS